MFPSHRMRQLTFMLASTAALFALATSAQAAPTYAVIDLASTATCGATAIDDLGVVVGACDDTAVVWRGGVANKLGRLPGGTFSTATATNTSGVVVGDGDNGNFRPQSWVSTPSGLYNFFPNNGGNTHAIFIGDNGVIGGYYTKSLSGNTSSWRGAIWTPDPKDPRKYRTTDLPVLPGNNAKFTGVIPAAFNKQGQAAGYAVNDVIGQHAAFWDNDAAHTIRDLGVFANDWSSLAWGMNDLGQVVGESHPPASSRPILWNNDAAHTAVELPLLPGDNYGSASKINNLGQVLGTSAYNIPGTWNVVSSRMVIWRDGGVYELQSLLDPASAAGWTITYPINLNNLGQIVAFATRNGQGRVVVLTPLQ